MEKNQFLFLNFHLFFSFNFWVASQLAEHHKNFFFKFKKQVWASSPLVCSPKMYAFLLRRVIGYRLYFSYSQLSVHYKRPRWPSRTGMGLNSLKKKPKKNIGVAIGDANSHIITKIDVLKNFFFFERSKSNNQWTCEKNKNLTEKVSTFLNAQITYRKMQHSDLNLQKVTKQQPRQRWAFNNNNNNSNNSGKHGKYWIWWIIIEQRMGLKGREKGETCLSQKNWILYVISTFFRHET